MKAFLLLFLLLFSQLVVAQTRTVRGTVRSAADKAPVPGATVLLKNTTIGTTTGPTGTFSLTTTTASTTLVVASIGYKTQEVVVSKTTDSVRVLLQEDARALAEVVVTGYKTMARRDITGSVATLSSTKGVSGPGSSAQRQTYKGPQAGAGQLTAGEIHDYSKWKLWQDIAQRDLKAWQQQWHIRPLERYSVQLTTADGYPISNAVVSLKTAPNVSLWTSRSDNTGKSELWNNLFDSAAVGQPVFIEALVDGQPYILKKPVLFNKGLNRIQVSQPCRALSAVDISFVVDATGSMQDEINYLKAELSDIVNRTRELLPASSIRLSSVFYRDVSDDYLTHKSDFTESLDSISRFINGHNAAGGDDYPEAVDQALNVAVHELNWNEQAKARLLFLILDAPPHDDDESRALLKQSIQKASEKGIRIIPIVASGIDKSTEYLMRSWALATNGTYVFLTDHSGIGDAHIAPTTDSYKVELLNKVLVRLITSFAQTPDCQPIRDVAQQTTRQYEDGTASTNAALNGGNEDSALSWKHYPNPTSDVLHVDCRKAPTEVFVADVTGKIVLRTVPTERRFTLNMVSFPTGIYFLKINNGKTWESARFILNRQ
ncbi:T9SS C-terminal target domain-containing protein [Fibrisoma montanum]|uniref:T9SS C-terminal target domain-containing protein n=1 Tax=Fibrisoma montanum TaxID=2305895 RepID=A0A418MDL5_9BACT|nr:carboxypeptidase-like regulatory domain-containing protein [Fibrisoma montanum]RIV24876.1 T9SS C-terminal target domain-containing protein [Fibrisoma montanum]